MRALVNLYVRNWKTVLLTFEIFWICVFLLNAAGAGRSGVAEFVYVNF